MQTITFIGNGNMALSIAQGLKDKYHIEVVGRDNDKLAGFEKSLGVKIDKYLLDRFDITDKNIILCTKPNNIQEVSGKLKGKARYIISILAGTTLQTLKDSIKAQGYIRAMPNLAASVQASMTTFTGDIEFIDEAQIVLGSIGSTRYLSSEKEIDIATALAGSGPAYLALIAEALSDGAVKQGLKRDDAMAIMRGLFDGFGKLIQETHPSLLKDSVMSPGGTTAAGYAALEDGNVRASCIKAIEKAYQKAKELA
jgi:pyrroline-5-carboxylate reductase